MLHSPSSVFEVHTKRTSSSVSVNWMSLLLFVMSRDLVFAGVVLHLSSYAEACSIAAKGMKDHGKALKTTKNYDGHVWHGRDFLAAFIEEQCEVESQWTNGEDSSKHLSAEGEDEMPSKATKHPQFHATFSGPPIECTPYALALFLAHKCFAEDCGKSTAAAIHAGFKRHYDQMYVQ